MFDTVKTQRELAAIFAPSGHESQLLNRITEMVKPYADECYSDALGNLIVRKKGTGTKIMLSAHMDSIGLVVTHIDEKGFLRFCPVGGLHIHEILGHTVTFGRGINGVIFAEQKTKVADLKVHHLYVDIGAIDRESALKLVKVGDMGVFSAETYVVGNRIVSPYLDDRIGCVVLLQVLSMLNSPANDVYFVFSAQEEVGLRGAKTAAYGIEPDVALAVDVTLVGDIPECEVPMNCCLGKGAAVKIRDNSLIAHPKVVKWLETVATKAKITTQREVLPFGGTDAGSIHITRAGVMTGAISIPTRYVHSMTEMADLGDIEACTRLLLAAVNAKIDL